MMVNGAGWIKLALLWLPTALALAIRSVRLWLASQLKRRGIDYILFSLSMVNRPGYLFGHVHIDKADSHASLGGDGLTLYRCQCRNYGRTRVVRWKPTSRYAHDQLAGWISLYIRLEVLSLEDFQSKFSPPFISGIGAVWIARFGLPLLPLDIVFGRVIPGSYHSGLGFR